MDPAGSTAADTPTLDVRGGEPQPDPGRELIGKVAKADPKAKDAVSDQDAVDALDWFLSDVPEESRPATRHLELNVGGPIDENGNAIDNDLPPRWIKWTIQAIPEERIIAIRKMASGNRAQRRTRAGEVDEAEVSRRLVVEATLNPDLVEAAQKFKLPDGSVGTADPSLALQYRFSRIGKTGLITQIAGAVLALSGYDGDDVRDSIEVKAAGNS